MLEAHVEKLLKQRYYIDNKEDWKGLSKRIIKHVAKNEDTETQEEMFSSIYNRIWIPNSPCLVNSGKKNGGLFACFVVGPDEDTLENHFETLKDIADVAKAGGGCGFSLSNIRAANSPVAGSSHGYSYGGIKWSKLVSQAMDMMTQSGFRKMALMNSIDGYHKDAEEFVDLKKNGADNSLYNFNMSLMVTDKWMTQSQVEGTEESKLFNKLTKNAWSSAEPGLLFYDNWNSGPYFETGQEIITTNPCGEQGIPSYGSCNLGSINLAHDIFYNNKGEFNFGELWIQTQLLIRFLDDVGSVNKFPNQKFAKWYKENRPVGAGIMGLADALIKLKLSYGKPDSLAFIHKVIGTMYDAALQESIELGKERGVPLQCQKLSIPRRNITLLSIAPTGSIAFIANCSHSVEPIYSPDYVRTDERGETYTFTHPEKDNDYFKACVGVSIDKIVSPMEHLYVQAVCQQYVDSGVSKTINLPESTTVEDIRNIFYQAWILGCKGITIYRDNSRSIQVLNHKEEKEDTCETCNSSNCQCEHICQDASVNPFGCEGTDCNIIKIEGCKSCTTCGNSMCSIK